MSSILNLILSQVCWFCCVLGGANGLPWLGPIVTAGFAGLVLRFSEQPEREGVYLALATALGSAGDRAVVAAGGYQFTQGMWEPWGYPLWMSALWLAFAATFGHSMKAFSGRYLLAAVFGAVGGPLAYSAGQGFGAISIRNIALIGGYWALILPGLFWLRSIALKSQGEMPGLANPLE